MDYSKQKKDLETKDKELETLIQEHVKAINEIMTERNKMKGRYDFIIELENDNKTKK